MANRSMRTERGGSSVRFLLFGVILVLLVSGGLYALRGNHDNTSTPAKSNSASKSSSPEPSGSVKTTAPSPSTTQKGSSVSSTSQSGQTNSKAADNSSAGALPATGPTDTVPEIMVLALLTGITASYVQSRRELVRVFNR